MHLSGWGQYPKKDSQLFSAPQTPTQLQHQLLAQPTFTGIARGMGRSYGDSALAAQIISTRYLNYFISFDEKLGLLKCASGITLEKILALIVPRGWFLAVTPGTKFVSVGGAIASDVHGKNHHVAGSFCDYVLSITLMLANGDILQCSRQQHPELFHASCGGMGLTGVIIDAELTLQPINSSQIHETTIKAANLDEMLALFDAHQQATYSVAWIDCLAKGRHLGRSLLMLGEHSQEGTLNISSHQGLPILFDMPSFLLNKYSIGAFNALYYHRMRQNQIECTTHYDSYFYPLDGLLHWNRLYGKAGFTQYQFVIPKDAGKEGLSRILQCISASGRGSFLAVLKTLGKQASSRYLSFPLEGYTLALDFKIENGLFALLEKLDRMVLAFGGRIYLSKDARMSELTFKQSYPAWEAFQHTRCQYQASKVFCSLQSMRLGLNND